MMEPTLEVTSVAGYAAKEEARRKQYEGKRRMIHNFITERGTDMVARLVLEDGRYGRDGCLIADSPMIEFYSVTEHEHNNAWLREMYGLDRGLYFISRYNLDTFLFGFMGDSPLDRGLCLEGSARQYDLTERECQHVAAHLFMQLAEAQA